ncbi:LAMI_0G04610g1_1 [Lachancea mirantina]|uniref:ATPase synthesis protein 25 n=1 Tax=Lachancea mirantina TaxID=1230905 RepID=A0A1G4K8Q2_9SACH|nr:LAMI_0G04610g1_1 [Lachancea mirantina]
MWRVNQARTLSKVRFLPIFAVSRRFLSATTVFQKKGKENGSEQDSSPDVVSNLQSKISPANQVPWYLQVVEKPPQSGPQTQLQTIQLPQGSPDSLKTITEFLRDKLALENILVFDLRQDKESFTTACSRIGDFMVLATGKSGKHCHKSFVEVNTLLKNIFMTVGDVEGNISAKELRKRQRRLARRSNLNRSAQATLSRQSALSDCWYMIDCHVDGIFVNILTENRRHELNLEELYAPESDRHLYERGPDAEASEQLDDDDNVLAGLRRLASRHQQRFYSTSASQDHSVYKSLLQQDFKRASQHISSPSLGSLKSVTQALETIQEGTEIDVNNWRRIFDRCWPLYVSKAEQDEYWSQRLYFFKLLNCAAPKRASVRAFLTDYLVLKAAQGGQLSRNDLCEFLQSVVATLKDDKTTDYWDLVAYNKLVVDAIKLYQVNNPEVIRNEQVVCGLIDTMRYTNSKTTVCLHAVYELIDFISEEFQARVPDSVVKNILTLLAQRHDWNKLFSFWAKCQGKTADLRPWPIFLDTFTNFADRQWMQYLINEGHLLWIKRNGVKITPELRTSLARLFSLAEPSGVAYKDLYNYLVDNATTA